MQFENENTWISIEYLILIGIDCQCYLKKSMLEISYFATICFQSTLLVYNLILNRLNLFICNQYPIHYNSLDDTSLPKS